MVLPYGVSHEHNMQGILCVRGSYISVIGGFFIFKKIPAHFCALSTVVIP
jgi:hypothetical protein